MSLVYRPHVCNIPRKYRFPAPYSDAEPAYPAGTIWRCDLCDRYWKFRHLSGSRYGDWQLVQPWHLISVIRLLRAESDPDICHYIDREEHP